MSGSEKAPADPRDFDAARIRRLEFANEQLRLELAELRGDAQAEAERLRAELNRITRERDANAAEVDRLSRELVTLRNRAETVGLAAAPADPETLDCPRSDASEGDPPRQDAQEGR
jgi:chromosome segregation ATPase